MFNTGLHKCVFDHMPLLTLLICFTVLMRLLFILFFTYNFIFMTNVFY